MSKHIRTLGAIGALAAGAAIMAPQAFAHENLAVDTEVSCAGIDYRVSGIDQGTSVTVTRTRTINGVTVTESDQWSDKDEPIHLALPAQFVGSLSSTIESEGRKDTAGATLDCRTPANPPTPPNLTPPPPPISPPPTCADLRVQYPKAGPRFWIDHGCAVRRVPPPPPPPPGKVCYRPAKLAIVQQQTGTFYTETYPLRVIIANTTGAATPAGALMLTDTGLQNFVAPNGLRTERLIIPVGPMRKGQVRRIDRTMGFTGVEAYREVFTTTATFHVNGRICGYTLDRAFEG